MDRMYEIIFRFQSYDLHGYDFARNMARRFIVRTESVSNAGGNAG